MSQNETGVESQKSEHDTARGMSRATTLSLDRRERLTFDGVQVAGQNVYYMSRVIPLPLRGYPDSRFG